MVHEKINEAVASKITTEATGPDGKVRYWIAVKGCEDVVVHITVG